MEHLSLEIFDLPTAENPNPTGSKYAALPEDTAITITDTSEIFASGDVWSYSFTLNAYANAQIFGTAGEVHGGRLHEQLNKRRARLWVDGLPLYLGYLLLDDEAEVSADGNVEVKFESGQKTFEEMIEGTSAREVSVGDVVIGVALNRKRVVNFDNSAAFTLDGLKAYANKDERLKGVDACIFGYYTKGSGDDGTITPYTQRWPKLVKSHGEILNSSGNSSIQDYTNVQTPYDAGHPFCNINICYPLKSLDEKGEETAGRGYTVRLAHGKPTVDGGDDQTRFNNAPNFYLLYFIDRLFKDLSIHISENQAADVEDLRRVFMLNYGCHYEEIENDNDYYHDNSHTTPADRQDKQFISRYGQYYMPLLGGLVRDWSMAGKNICVDDSVRGKVLMRDVEVEKDGISGTLLSVGSVEGRALGSSKNIFADGYLGFSVSLQKSTFETRTGAYSAYLAYATGDNYPNVEISEIVNAMKSMFGVRLLFSNDYSTVRIVLLRNIFRSSEVQEVECDIEDKDEKIENNIRGFRMTYNKGTDSTSYYYKGFADLLPRAAKTWKDTSDKHDYSQWRLDADYDFIKQYVSAFDRTCYVTSVNGNAYGTQVDEDEDVLFPSLLEWAGYMDAEDGDCSKPESDGKTVEEIQCGATPVLMNKIGIVYASLFSGDMKAPTPDMPADLDSGNTEHPSLGQKIATFGRATKTSYVPSGKWVAKDPYSSAYFRISGNFDLYISEGFQIRMKDSYAVSNGGTPFDEADPGLCFGIMRGSGGDAYVRYYTDADDTENETWDVEPGSGAISHPDTCDEHGNLWVYGASAGRTATAAEFRAAGWNVSGTSDQLVSVTYNYAIGGNVFVCTPVKYCQPGARPDPQPVLTKAQLESEVSSLWNSHGWNFAKYDYWKIILSADKADGSTAYAEGRFSLKLRGEKLNPYYKEGSTDQDKKDQYLTITNENLRQRGLCDQFYKEYSYWVRNARIVRRTVHMELAQLLSIDKTKKVRVGDVMGFIRKMQYTVSNTGGLGSVTMEIMYI